MLPRLAIALAPLLAVLAVGFALYHAWGAVLAARAGNWPVALLYGVLGFGGVALALALLQSYRHIRAARRRRHD